MLLGLDLVKCRESKEPDVEGAAWIFERCKELGCVIGKGGSFGNVLRVKPPMIITKEDVRFGLEVLDRVFYEYENKT